MIRPGHLRGDGGCKPIGDGTFACAPGCIVVPPPKYDHAARVQITHMAWREADDEEGSGWLTVAGCSDRDRLNALTELLGNVAYAIRHGEDIDGALLRVAGCALAGVEQNTEAQRRAA